MSMLKKIGLAYIIIVSILGCSSIQRVEYIDLPDESNRDIPLWYKNSPPGFQVLLGCATAASNAYNYISDTSIKVLQSSKGARQAGDLVTEARDAYRKLESYGRKWQGNTPTVSDKKQNPNTGEILYFSKERSHYPKLPMHQFGYSVTIIPQYRYFDQHTSIPLNATDATIVSDRGKTIAKLSNNSEVVEWLEPFASIVKGDRIGSIPDLIAHIKR